jgi:hypothetical protein
MNSVDKFISHTGNDGILNPPVIAEHLEAILRENNIILPNDFKAFYLAANGMNDQDKEGFLFHSIEELIDVTKEFKSWVDSDTFLFVDYLTRSWFYAVRLEGDSYTIGIVPHANKFVPITHSLSEFIELYIQDDNVLYNWDR